MTTADAARIRAEKLRAFARALAVTDIVLAGLVLFGWAGGGASDLLVRIRPAYSAMVPSTAICFVMLNAGFLFAMRRERVSGSWTAMLLAVASGLIAASHLSSVGEAFSVRIDRMFLPDFRATDAMAAGTAVNVLLGAFCVFQLGRSRPGRLAYSTAATLGMALALIALAGYLFDAEALYDVYVFTAMALHTALAFLILFMALLLARPDRGWLPLLIGPGRGSGTARRLFPLVVGLPIALSYLTLRATDAGFLNADVRLSLLAVAIAALATAGLLQNARVENVAERREAAEERRTRQLLDGLDAAVFAVDPSGLVRFANRAAAALSDEAGAPSPEAWLRTADFRSVDDHRPLPPEETPLSRLMRDENLSHLTIGYRDRRGEDRVLRLSGGGYDMGGDQPVRILSMIDVTEEERNRERLIRSERLDTVGQMAGGVAHDFGNLLGVVQLSADVGRMAPDTAEMRRHFDAIRTACARGSELTGRILAFTQDQSTRPEAVDLTAFLRDVAALARRTIPSNIELEVELPADEVWTTCEPGQLESAVLNLLLNARHAISAAGRRGRIRLRLQVDADEVCIAVEDDGPGMPTDVRRRATEPFFTTRQTSGGSGLGLATVEAFAERSGGRFDLDSEVGRGTSARLCLARLIEAPRERTDAGAEALDLSGLRLMVVEDDPFYGDALEATLRSCGAEILRVSTGDDAAAALTSGARVDLLLTDITLRGELNGFAVANIARGECPSLPLVYLSGYADMEAQAEHHTPGIFLRKPVTVETLVSAIRHALNPVA